MPLCSVCETKMIYKSEEKKSNRRILRKKSDTRIFRFKCPSCGNLKDLEKEDIGFCPYKDVRCISAEECQAELKLEN